MQNIIETMLRQYQTKEERDKLNAAKEIMQEVILCGLARGGFFQKAAFYGGTALRIFYGLNRFSEDLDFSLKAPDLTFRLEQYFPLLEKEAAVYGLNVQFSEKKKTADSKIQSAFLKGNTLEHLLYFYGDQQKVFHFAKNDVIKIKFEVDIDPPPYADFEPKIKMLPAFHEVMLYDLPSLFAGKLHAVLCRAWRHRTKGRDLYDYGFYLQQGARVNMPHLKAKLVVSGVLKEEDAFDGEILKDMLCSKFMEIDYALAKLDVEDFISDRSSLSLWRADFFQDITRHYLKV